jgi:hypothetical protein
MPFKRLIPSHQPEGSNQTPSSPFHEFQLKLVFVLSGEAQLLVLLKWVRVKHL